MIKPFVRYFWGVSKENIIKLSKGANYARQIEVRKEYSIIGCCII